MKSKFFITTISGEKMWYLTKNKQQKYEYSDKKIAIYLEESEAIELVKELEKTNGLKSFVERQINRILETKYYYTVNGLYVCNDGTLSQFKTEAAMFKNKIIPEIIKKLENKEVELHEHYEDHHSQEYFRLL